MEQGVKSPWLILLAQFKEIMVMVLLIAAVISFVLGEYIDGTVILIIVIVNAVIGLYPGVSGRKGHGRAQEDGRANRSRAPRRPCRVEISSTQVVPGEIVLLEAGNVVPADGRVIEAVNLKVEEAALTGESEPVEKQVEPVEGDHVPLATASTWYTWGRS